MDELALHEVGHIFSCCEPCVRNRRWKQIILVVTFLLMTFDMVTDWINYAEWSGVGGYDQYYFVSIFQKGFLCVAAVGTGLWIIEFFVLIKKFIGFCRSNNEENGLVDQKSFHECLPNRDLEDDLDSLPELQAKNKREVEKDDGHLSEVEYGNSSESESNEVQSHSERNLSNDHDSVSQSEVETCNGCQSEVMNNNSEKEIKNYMELDVDKYNESGLNEDREEDIIYLCSNKNTNNCQNPLPEESGKYTQQEVRKYGEMEFKNYNKPPSATEKVESSCEIEDRNDNDTSIGDVNYSKFKSKLEVKNTMASGKRTDEQKKISISNKTIDRLGVLARILVGLLEDFPVVLTIYYPTIMPMCGVPAKQYARSGVTIATITSSMLNSLWTMICLFFELCGCAETGVCCSKTKNDSHRKGKDAEGKSLEHYQGQDISRQQLKKFSKPCMKKAVLTGGKVIVYILIYLIFSTTFTLEFLTVGHILGIISLKFMDINSFYLRSAVMTGDFGAGLDAKPDQAMFIYLHYKLPDWHYISLNSSKPIKSASFRQVINRLYIGQFQELSHLKDGILTKAISCSKAMPFL